MIAYIFDGFANASSVFSGIAIGEKNFSKLKWTLKKSINSSIVISILLSIVMIIFDESFLMFYTKNIEVIEITNQYKIWIIIFPLVVSFGLVVYGNFTGAMETKYIKKSMLQALIVFLIFYFLATEIYQNHGLWLSFLAFSLSRSVFLMRYVKRFLKKYENLLIVPEHL